MPEENVPAPTVDGRVSTGTAGLDAMLEGGLVPRRPYLIVGPSGTGKTALAVQFLCEGVQHGERGLLVTVEEPPNEVRINHRGLEPALSQVYVFDAIPDIMRYERVPFKDIASVRATSLFKDIPFVIRRSPELSAVEVTMTGLEQMLRTEVTRRNYTRLVIDSLTALQYFCMKGFDPVAGAQTFLRFLSDLRVTTLLTVESPLEDVETPERALARGEIRLFRWELDGQTVRAIGVEKFRGSPHDVRLHPYRIGPKGIDINLDVTISRDTRQIVESSWPAAALPTPLLLEESTSPIDPLAEVVRDLVVVGAEVGPVKFEIEAALTAAGAGELETSRAHLSRAAALAIGLSDSFRDTFKDSPPQSLEAAEAHQRMVQRGEAARAGLPPTRLPPPKLLEFQLEQVLLLFPSVAEPAGPEPVPPEPTLADASTPPIPAEVRPAEPLDVTATGELPLPPSTSAPPPAEVEVARPDLVAPLAEPPSPEPVAKEYQVAAVQSPDVPLPPPPPPPPPPSPPPPLEIVDRDARPLSRPPSVPPPLPAAPRELPVAASPAATSTVSEVPGPPRDSPPARRTHMVRVEQRPPLPKLVPVTPEVLARSLPRELPHAAAAVRGPAPPAPQPASPAGSASLTDSTAPGTGAALLPPSPAAKRRRKAPAAARRKIPVAVAPAPAAETTLAAPSVSEASTQPGLPHPNAPESGVTEPTPAPGPAPTTKPKKRTARKRKAPPVVAAAAGTVPPEAPGATDDRSRSDATPGPSPESR